MSDAGSETGRVTQDAGKSSWGEGLGAPIAMLEQGLWRRLTIAEGTIDIAQAWAPLMFSMLDEAETCAVFLADPDGGRLRTVANWPEARVPGGELLCAAETAVEQGRGVVRGDLPSQDQPDAADKLVAIATPLSVDGNALGVVGLEFRPLSQPALHSAMRRLQWGAAWIRDALRSDVARKQDRQYSNAVQALNSIASVAEQGDFATASRAAATDLATRFDCDRVSIGFRRLGRSEVAAISHSAQFGKRMNLVRLIAAAMDEAVDQRGVVIYPPADAAEPMAAHRHEKLAQGHSIDHIVTVPLFAVDRYVGAVLFERSAERPFSQDDADILEAVSTVLAPVIEEKRRNSRWLITKFAEFITIHFVRLAGPGRLAYKVALLAICALAAFFWLAEGADRVAADAVVESSIQRTMAAPFDGFIAESNARAGDLVESGQLLVRLDDRELTLERLSLVTQHQRHKFDWEVALSNLERAQTLIKRAQMDQTDAQIALVDKQLAHTRLVAPFDGLVTSGDLSQSIGASVARGDALLTIAPADKYRIALRVDERRIADIQTGQSGSLLVTALPDQNIPLTVEKITPVAEYGEGATTFRVEARLTHGEPSLRSGMEGVAKIDVKKRNLFAIWTRPMVDWFRIWSWRWLGLKPE